MRMIETERPQPEEVPPLGDDTPPESQDDATVGPEA